MSPKVYAAFAASVFIALFLIYMILTGSDGNFETVLIGLMCLCGVYQMRHGRRWFMSLRKSLQLVRRG
jgi:hypothetical protein